MILAAVTVCGACAEQRAVPTEVATEAGALRGTALNSGVIAYLGIPYAKPPVGDLRWRPPEPSDPWDGVRAATAFGPTCPQGGGTSAYYRRAARRLGRDTMAVPAIVGTAEDCLYLNVWASGGPGEDLRPVLVWIHGGAGDSGASADPLFRGARFAARGLVVITVNYRLGPLGFLAHPTLSGDDPRGVSGNYALHDLVRALEWVRDNATAFGGDPGRVTLAGQSAGANLVELLMLVPAARGLFQRAVLQSATRSSLRWLEADGSGTSAEAAGVRYLGELGVSADTPPAVLRAIPVDSLLAAAARAGPDAPAQAVVDGQLIPDSPDRLLEQGRAAAMPVLRGRVDDEFSLLIPPDPIDPTAYRELIDDRYGALASVALTTYPPGPDGEATRRRFVRLLSADIMGVPTLRFLRRASGPVWLYRFAWRPDDGAVGAFHGVDLPFVFGTHHAAGWWDETPEVERLTDRIQAAWVRFAATGDPGGGELPSWPSAVADSAVAMVLAPVPRVEPLPAIDLVAALADRRMFGSDDGR